MSGIREVGMVTDTWGDRLRVDVAPEIAKVSVVDPDADYAEGRTSPGDWSFTVDQARDFITYLIAAVDEAEGGGLDL